MVLPITSLPERLNSSCQVFWHCQDAPTPFSLLCTLQICDISGKAFFKVFSCFCQYLELWNSIEPHYSADSSYLSNNKPHISVLWIWSGQSYLDGYQTHYWYSSFQKESLLMLSMNGSGSMFSRQQRIILTLPRRWSDVTISMSQSCTNHLIICLYFGKISLF